MTTLTARRPVGHSNAGGESPYPMRSLGIWGGRDVTNGSSNGPLRLDGGAREADGHGVVEVLPGHRLRRCGVTAPNRVGDLGVLLQRLQLARPRGERRRLQPLDQAPKASQLVGEV